ncbi:MAG: sodium:solute symporter [Verrucomicrobiae bacterium]|nr:sodium:solute symporter [Verrucomicrobiae bacterium]
MNEITNSVAVATNALATAATGKGTGTVFDGLDWCVIALFAIGMIAVVLFSMRKKNESGKDYFLSGRDANWLQIGSSIFSSNIGSEHLVGLAGAGFVTGMAMAHWEMQGWMILILGWVFVPLYDRMKVFTMPEFLELRFSRGSRNVLSVLTMASLVLTKIAATIYAGDVVIRTLLNVDHVPLFGHNIDIFWVIALGLAFTTGLYTIFGGMRVIMYTAVLQTPVLLFGSIAILFIGLHKLGGGSLIAGWHATTAAVGPNIHLIRPNSDSDWPWLAVIPGSMIIGFWYWCTDQYIVQRVLAGKNQQESRRGSILAGYLKLTPVFIFLVPGMVAYALTKTAGSGFTTSGDAAYTSLVAQILPHGIRGIVACGMIVALMASLASKFNASATLFTMDFYREWYPNASGKTEVLVGRIATAVIVFMGICWVLVIKALHSNLYEYLQSVQGYLSPAIAVLFVVGVFWKRATATAAIWAFIIGVAGGFARLVADLLIGRPINTLKDIAKDNLNSLDQLVKGTVSLTADGIQHVKDQIQDATTQMVSAVPAIKEQLALKVQLLQQTLAGTALTPDQYNEKKNMVDAALPAFKEQLHQQWGMIFSMQQIHWLYWCQILFVTTAVLMIGISLFTKAPEAKTVKYTWYGASAAEKAATRESWNAMDVVLSAIVVIICVVFYIKFF